MHRVDRPQYWKNLLVFIRMAGQRVPVSGKVFGEYTLPMRPDEFSGFLRKHSFKLVWFVHCDDSALEIVMALRVLAMFVSLYVYSVIVTVVRRVRFALKFYRRQERYARFGPRQFSLQLQLFEFLQRFQILFFRHFRFFQQFLLWRHFFRRRWFFSLDSAVTFFDTLDSLLRFNRSGLANGFPFVRRLGDNFFSFRSFSLWEFFVLGRRLWCFGFLIPVIWDRIELNRNYKKLPSSFNYYYYN